MPEHNRTQDQPVTVEELLRLKRHERPDEAFWARFDRELHEKTLRTLVKPKPSTRNIWAALLRWQAALPLAGAAAFALSLAISNDVLKLPSTPAPVELASLSNIPADTEAAIESPQASHPVGSPSFVVSALTSHDGYSEGRYTQVPASRSMTPAHRPDVQFIGGTIATAIPSTGYSAGIY